MVLELQPWIRFSISFGPPRALDRSSKPLLHDHNKEYPLKHRDKSRLLDVLSGFLLDSSNEPILPHYPCNLADPLLKVTHIHDSAAAEDVLRIYTKVRLAEGGKAECVRGGPFGKGPFGVWVLAGFTSYKLLVDLPIMTIWIIWRFDKETTPFIDALTTSLLGNRYRKRGVAEIALLLGPSACSVSALPCPPFWRLFGL